ncbi:MAG: DUF2206 domain-containing protein [Chloroflexi bacterium]|nr:DUF2206 domain-containing protein [Chloroflexota bacterium]
MELANNVWARSGGRILTAAPAIGAGAAALPMVVMTDVPGLREVVAFIALFLIPGALILYLLRLRDLDPWELLAYACGLSLVVVMALGLALNGLRGLGVERPLSSMPVAVAVGAATACLAAVAALWQRELPSVGVRPGELLKPYTTLCLLPPAVVILGTQLANARQDNTFLLAAIALLALFPLAAFLPRLLPEKAYPLAVVAISVSLLLHRSLISPRLTGFDIHAEYFFGSLVLKDGYWDQSIPNVYNSMLSLTIVPPMFSAVADVDLLWVYKAVYPLLFSLMPLSLFLLWRRAVGSRAAFLAACFLMFTQPFYQLMPGMARMEMGLLFVALVLLTLSAGSGPQAVALRIIFAGGMIVSHYSVAYFLIPALAAAPGLSWLYRLARTRSSGQNAAALTPAFLSLFLAFTFFWYVYVSAESAPFDDAVRTLSDLGRKLGRDFFSPQASQGLYLATQSLTPLRDVARYLHFGFQGLTVIGVVWALLRWRRGPFPPELTALAVPALAVNAATVVVPYFAAGTFGMERLLMGTLIFLAPFAVMGGLALFSGLAVLGRLALALVGMRNVRLQPVAGVVAALLLAAGLGAYLLFNSGFVYQVAGERPNAVPLSRGWMAASANADEKLSFFAIYPPLEDFAAGEWLGGQRAPGIPVYADLDGWAYVLREWIPQREMSSLDPDRLPQKSGYVFLRYLNTKHGIMAPPPYEGWEGVEGHGWWLLRDMTPWTEEANLIYANGTAKVYLSRPGE